MIKGLSWERVHLPLSQPLQAINGTVSMARSILLLCLQLASYDGQQEAHGVAELAPLSGGWHCC